LSGIESQSERICSSVSFFTTYQVNLIREDLLFTGEESVSLTWLPDAVFPMEDPGNYTVDIWLYTLSRTTWGKTACLASAYPNSGIANITIPHMERSASGRFSAVAVQIALNTNETESRSLTTAAGLWTVVAYATDAAPTRKECNDWAENTDMRMTERNTINSRPPPCPCMLQQARAPNSGVTEQTLGDAVKNFFNPGAATCFYQSTLNRLR